MHKTDPTPTDPIPESLLAYMLSRRYRLRSLMALTILRTLMVAPIPLITRSIIDDSIPAGDPAGVALKGGMILGLLCLHTLVTRRSIRMLADRVPFMMRELRSRIFRKIQFMHFGFLDKTAAGRLLSKYAFDTAQLEGCIIPMSNVIIPAFIYAFATTAVLAYLNWHMTVLLLTILPFLYLIRKTFFARIREQNRRVRKRREHMTGRANEFISAIRLVRGSGQETRVTARMEESSQAFEQGRKRQITLNQSMGLMTFLSTELLAVSILCVGAALVIFEYVTLGVLFAFVGALPVILSPINLVTQFSQQFFLGRESYYSVRELLASGYIEDWQGQTKLPQLEGRIEFDHVHFHYESDSPQVLKDFTLTIEAGESVALVGSSGSGKSTLVNLLLGLYQPTQGEIRVDGVPQHELAIRWLRKQCSIVMQDSLLLSGSIKENILFGRPGASDEEVQEAAKKAEALEFIEKLPQGYDTLVGERGVALSGGQRQRIAIARALLRDPVILILDEATSALDYQSEAKVQAALEELAKDRTVITIAHRLSTVRSSDRIIVMDHGAIAESGSYEELALKPEGTFQKILAAQG